jgi:hypothetical protein
MSLSADDCASKADSVVKCVIMLPTLDNLTCGSRAEAIAGVDPASEEKNVEVLGDRVRCDVRYGELHLPESEYRSFFDKCMGSAARSE